MKIVDLPVWLLGDCGNTKSGSDASAAAACSQKKFLCTRGINRIILGVFSTPI